MKCDFCGKTKTQLLNISYGKICSQCEYLLLGVKMNDSADFDYTTHDGIALWVQNKVVTDCWQDFGLIGMDIKHMAQYVPLLSPIEVISMLRHLNKRDEVFCSECGKIISRKNIAGSHFAGNYCKKCWGIYKKERSGRCLGCGAPRYSCSC